MTDKIPRITPEVFQIGGAGLSAPEDAAVYLVAIDGRDRVRRFIRQYL